VSGADPLSHSIYRNNSRKRRQREQKSCHEEVSFRPAGQRFRSREHQAEQEWDNRRPSAHGKFPWDETPAKKISMALLEKLEILIGKMKAGKFDDSRQANEQRPQEQTDECPVIFMEL
jgi:hypothetical protein